MLVAGVAFSDVVVGVHVLGAIIGFGVLFVFPPLLTAAARVDPAMTPWLLRMRQRMGRLVVNPGLVLIVLAGIYLATDEHYWSSFFVQWGIGAALVLGALEGAIIIPRSARLAGVAERDLATTAVPAGGQRVSATWSSEYLRGYRLVALAGVLSQAIVVVTVFLMATRA